MIEKKGGVRQILPISFIMLLGEFVAYLGDVAFVYLHGTSAASDAYTAAIGFAMLPAMLFSACAGATFIPLYMEQDVGERDRFTSNLLSVFFLLSACLCILMQAAARPLITMMNPGFDAERLRLTLELSRILLPTMMLMSVSMILSSLLEARSRFLVGPLSMLPRSILMIISSLLFAPVYGIYAIAAGALASGFIQMMIMVFASRKIFHFTPILRLKEAYLGKMLRLSLPAIVGIGVNSVAQLVSRAVASGLNVGDMTAMSYSFQLTSLLNSVLIVPITTVAFPRLSKSAAKGNSEAVSGLALRYAETICLLLMPLVALSMVFYEDIVRLAYGRGMFGEDSIRVTASVFLFQLPGLVFLGLRSILSNTFHSFQDTKTPLYVGCVTAAVNIALCFVFPSVYGVSGLALASTVTGVISFVLMLILLIRRYGGEWTDFVSELLKAGIAGCLCMITAMSLAHYLPNETGAMASLARILICALPCLFVYFLALFVLRARFLGGVVGRLGIADYSVKSL